MLASAPSSPPPQPTSNHIASTSSNPSSSILLSQSPGIHTIFSGALTHLSPHWLVDSGANEHICSSLHFLSSPYTIKPVCVNLPNGNTVTIHIAGTVVFPPSFQITNVLYSPHFKVNLIYVAKICICSHCLVKFLPNHCIIQDLNSNRMIGLADKCDGLYKLRVPPSAFTHQPSVSVVSHCSIPPNNDSKSVNSSSVSFIPESALWHFRLGHLSNQRLTNMHSLYSSICIDNKAICDICKFAKHKRLPYSTSSSHATSKFDLLHCDIWGPLGTPSIHGHRYFITIVDDFSRFVWIILIKNKSEVSSHIQNFIILMEYQFHITPKIIRTDNGPEFALPSF